MTLTGIRMFEAQIRDRNGMYTGVATIGLAMSCESNKANVGYGRHDVSTCTTLG
jgi:hypothetical protein